MKAYMVLAKNTPEDKVAVYMRDTTEHSEEVSEISIDVLANIVISSSDAILCGYGKLSDGTYEFNYVTSEIVSLKSNLDISLAYVLIDLDRSKTAVLVDRYNGSTTKIDLGTYASDVYRRMDDEFNRRVHIAVLDEQSSRCLTVMCGKVSRGIIYAGEGGGEIPIEHSPEMEEKTISMESRCNIIGGRFGRAVANSEEPYLAYQLVMDMQNILVDASLVSEVKSITSELYIDKSEYKSVVNEMPTAMRILFHALNLESMYIPNRLVEEYELPTILNVPEIGNFVASFSFRSPQYTIDIIEVDFALSSELLDRAYGGYFYPKASEPFIVSISLDNKVIAYYLVHKSNKVNNFRVGSIERAYAAESFRLRSNKIKNISKFFKTHQGLYIGKYDQYIGETETEQEATIIDGFKLSDELHSDFKSNLRSSTIQINFMFINKKAYNGFIDLFNGDLIICAGTKYGICEGQFRSIEGIIPFNKWIKSEEIRYAVLASLINLTL